MAFDGLMMAAVTAQLKGTIEGGAVSKLAMPEKDELLLTIRNNSNNYRLLISAGASLPLIYLTDENRQSPLTAPAFCMLLRKYLGGARIINVRQEGLERIIIIDFEHLDDLGDAQARRLRIRVKDADGNKYFAHTLNNTCVAPPRMLIAFLENNLQADGSVLIPKALQPYMGGKTVIKP